MKYENRAQTKQQELLVIAIAANDTYSPNLTLERTDDHQSCTKVFDMDKNGSLKVMGWTFVTKLYSAPFMSSS
ncbi:unnamed protein product [Fusarium venenatum]|uniref:Uncharacterized protein n=1 Tax=Fusarium venenatum TaxID=56646 RepID=A0A2L2TCE1_9HYPO|nr:uncharacterized protein FVRRES_05082 [Fusarium venenatum]CEI60646.1 unnamed protein product [Fusarium venenatum]